MALAAISSILLMAACGSGGSPAIPNPVGFTNGSLNGTYVISMSGTDVNGSNEVVPFAIVGTITANGKGGFSGGTLDVNDPGNTGVNLGVAVSSSSSYNVSTDGRGTGTLMTSVATFKIDFVLTSTNHGLIALFEPGATGSGTVDMQSSASQSSLSSLAFSLSGADSSGFPLGTAGAFTLNSSGTITSGIQDFNDNGSSAVSGLNGLLLTGGAVSLNSAGTSGTATLTNSSDSFGSLGFDVWVIDSTHLKFIETDNTLNVLSGVAVTQQASFTPGQLVFTLGGLDSTLQGPLAAGGFVTTDANGTLSNGTEDYNDAGIPNTVTGFSGACSTSAPFSSGRCQLALNGFSNGALNSFVFAAYPSSSGVLLLEIDSLGLMQGAGYAQTATSFTAPAGYGLNLSGLNTDGQGNVGEVDDIAQFNASAIASPGVNMTGILNENSILGGPDPSLSLSGTYTPDSPATGRGSISVPSIGTFIGTLNLEYYVVDGSTILFIDGDTVQVAVGTFQSQSSSSSAALPQSRISIVHPVVRPHSAMWRK